MLNDRAAKAVKPSLRLKISQHRVSNVMTFLGFLRHKLRFLTL